MSLFTELTRRKVFKVGGAYLVVAWLAVQAASIGFPAFDAPPWALRIFILVALLGFPIALVFAWAFELTPAGVKPESGARSTRAIMLVAVVLTTLAFFWYFKGQPSYRAEMGSESLPLRRPAYWHRTNARKRTLIPFPRNPSPCCRSPT